MQPMTAEQKQRARRRRFLQNRAAQGLLAAAVLVLLILIQAAAHLLLTPKRFSEAENRMLAQPPELTLASISDGSWFRSAEDWFADQFAGRDGWIALNLTAARLFGQTEINGVWLSRDGYLMEIPEEPDAEALVQTEQAICDFREAYPDMRVSLALIPNASCIMAEWLPSDAPAPDQRAILRGIYGKLDGVTCIDVTDTLRMYRSNRLFYRTDHHWTSYGAKLAFETMAKQLGIDAPVTTYESYLLTDSFEGTLASKAGSHRYKDSIEIYVPQPETPYTVTYGDTQKTVCTLYDREKLSEKDKYAVFLGGNHARVDIQTTNDTGRTLMLLKDSYANCFVQLLLPYYDRILVLDPRYYYDDLASALRREDVTDVLMLYNVNTFCQDRALSVVLRSACGGD